MRRADAGAIALVWAAAAAFFWPLVSGAGALYFRDTLSHYIPQAWLTLAAWREGGPPLWEPLLGLGYPLASDPHAMALYPLLAVMRLLPYPLSYGVLVVVHVPLGATFLYVLARRWSLRPGAALLAALAFMFNGYAVSTVALTTLLKGITWAPLAVLCFDMFLGGGSVAWIGGAALALAVAGAGTDPQYVAFAGVLVALGAFARPEPSARGRAAIVAGVAATGALAGLLLAYQYLPLGTLIGQSDRSRGLGTGEVGLFPVEPQWLVSMLVPTAFPDPADPRFLLSFPRTFQPFYPDLYFGAPLCALALAAPAAPARRTARVALAVALGGLVLALGEAGWLFPLMGRLVPPLRAFRFASKYFLFVGFALPLAAGLGFQALADGSAPARRLFTAAIAAAALLFLGLTALVAQAPAARAAAWLSISGPADPAALPELGELAARVLSRLGTALAVALVALALAVLQRRPRALPLWSGLWLLALGDLALGTHASVATAPAAALAAPPAAAALLTRSAGPAPRYATYFSAHLNYRRDRSAAAFYREGRELMRYLSGAAYGLNPLFASSSVRLAWEAPLVDLLAQLEPAQAARVLANLGVTHFVGLGEPGLGAPVGRAGPVAVERLPDPAPRAYIPAHAHVAAAGATLPTTAALLALREDAVYEAAAPGALAPRAVRRCALASYAREQVEVDVDLDGDGLLVVLDAWYPGWVARVDGQERPIHRVAGMVRGIRVHSGDHRVALTFEPAAFRIGARVSAAALLFTLGLLLSPFARKTKTAPAP